MKVVSIGSVEIANNLPFVLIAGPCQMESYQHALDMAGALQEIALSLAIPFIYKTSFDKANRTSVHGMRGLGLEKAIDVFARLKKELGVLLLTDVHEREQYAFLKDVVDVVQIPALLCRQTDLLLAAAETGLAVNVKKGQFLAPHDTKHIAQKIESAGNTRILLTERGTTFGYNTLVVDMCSLAIMAEETGYPVIFDATHSTQRPGALKGASGGDRRLAPILARAATAVGVAGLFMEVHQDPDHAPSDGPCMVKLEDMPGILSHLKDLDTLVKARML